MKKIIMIAFLLSFSASVFACGGASNPTTSTTNPTTSDSGDSSEDG